MKKFFANIILWLGIVLIIVSLIFIILSNVNKANLIREIPQITEDLYSLMPDVHSGFIDDRTFMPMSTVELGTTDYVGIIEIPHYKTVCPVSYHWDIESVKNQPCRYSGSIYSRDFVMGGTDYQFGFAKLITIGDEIEFTDMSGAKFTYIVSNISVEKELPSELISTEESDFVLFIKDSYSNEYTIIYCNL